MPTLDEFRAIIDRIGAKAHTPEDALALKAALESGSLRIEIADRGVGIGGDATNATIVTGDGNTIISGVDAQALIAALRQEFGALVAELLRTMLRGEAAPGRPDYQRPVAPAPFMFPEARHALGREAQRASLRNRLAEVAASQRGQIALITGKRGYGRTALARQFGREAAEQAAGAAATVCYGQFFADLRQRAGFYAPGAAAVAALVPAVEQRWPTASAIAGPVWVWLVAQIYRALGAEPGPADLRAPDDPSALRALLRQLKGPCVLVLERWEYAGEEWIQLIRELPKALLNERPLLVVLTMTLDQPFGQLHAEAIERNPALRAIQALRERSAATFYWLGDLKAEDIAAFIGPAHTPDLARQLLDWSGGQPALIEDIWATWIEMGVVARDASGAWAALKPADIDGGMYDFFANIIKARLQADDAADDFEIIEALLVHAAIEGMTCTAEVAAGASDRYLDEALELWDAYLLPTASEPGILRLVEDTDLDVARYQFTSLAARRAWERLGQDRETLLRTADALEATYQGGSDAVAERLIVLLEAAGQPDRAEAYYLRRAYASATGERLRWLRDSARLTAQQPYEWQRVFELELDLAWFYIQAGKYRAAEQAALAALDSTYKPSMQEQARALNLLGLSLEQQGNYTSAASVFQEALGLLKAIVGPAHQNTLATQHNLARVLQDQGAYAEARTLFEQVLEIEQHILGPSHPSTLTTQGNLANVLRDQGAYAEARALLEQVLTARQHTLGPSHPSTLAAQHNLANVLQDQGVYTEARALYEQVLKIKQYTLGPSHPSTLATQANLAGVLKDQGAYAEAEAFFRSALSMYETTLGVEHPNTQVVQRAYNKLVQAIQVVQAMQEAGNEEAAEPPSPAE